MAAKTSEWRPGPSVCRCCLTEGCYKDISTEYFWMGKREVYEEMLSDTLSINIAFSQSGGPNSNSRLICEPCISRLRDATDFRRQVLECERTFMQHLDPASSSLNVEDSGSAVDADVKLEAVKQEATVSDEDFDDHCDFLEDDDDLDEVPLTKLASKVPKKESVDLLDLLDNSQVTVKRKSTTKAKASPSKKVKITKEQKPSSSKVVNVKPEKKKKGQRGQSRNEVRIETDTNDVELSIRKPKYRRSARAEARIVTKRNASAILECWTLCPFRWKKNRFKCAYCEEDFTDCKILRDHVKLCSTLHSTKDIYNKFKEMPLINVDVTDALCTLCSISLSSVAQMREHLPQHGYEFDDKYPDGVLPFSLNKDSWKCVLCCEKFNNFLKLYEHMNLHYQHYICATCGKGYMTALRLRKHSEIHISGSFPCNECGKMFTMRAARDSHKATSHAKGPRYECPHCNIRFDGYYDRMAHLKEAHSENEVSYGCDHCNMTFKTSGKRAVHVRSVHIPLQHDFECAHCDRQFRTNYELKRHMVRHTGEKNFQCSLCGKSFTRNRALTTHLKTHQELNCKWCGKMFKQDNQLALHLSTAHPALTGFVSSSLNVEILSDVD